MLLTCRLELVVLVFCLILVGCKKDEGPIPIEEDFPEVGTIQLKNNVIKLEETDNNNLLSVEPAQLTFNDQGAQLQSVIVGDIILGAPTSLAPNGYLRKVTSISEVGGQLVFQTRQATLEEAIEECNIEEVFEFNWERSLNLSSQIDFLIDNDGNLSTAGDQIRFEGEFDVTPDVIFSLKKKIGGSLEAEMGLTVEAEKSFEIMITALGYSTGQDPIEAKIFEASGSPVLVGGFIWVKPEFEFKVGAMGEVLGGLTLGKRSSTSYTYIKAYKDGEWSTEKEVVDEEIPDDIIIEAEAAIEGYGKVGLNLKFYEILGFETYAKYFIRGEIETSSSNLGTFEYCISHGIKTGISLKEELFGSFDLTPLEITLSDDQLLPCGTINIGGGGTFVGDTILQTQQEVIEFGGNNYTKIEGSLVITGNEITDLSPLESIKEITGTFRAFFANGISSFSGLDNLESIGVNCIIEQCDGLSSLTGLNNLKTIAEDFRIEYCPALITLDGLDELQSIGERFIVRFNSQLSTIIGGGNLVSVERIEIDENSTLSSIGGFSGLNLLEDFAIAYNNNLSSISGLHNVSSLQLLSIHDNDNLESINLLGGLTEMEGNYLGIWGNPNLNTISGFQNLTSIMGELVISKNDNLETINAFQSLQFLSEGFGINENLKLQNIDFLENLNTVQNLYIMDNTLLTDFCGLNTLVQNNGISGVFEVIGNQYNPSLQDLVDGNCAE